MFGQKITELLQQLRDVLCPDAIAVACKRCRTLCATTAIIAGAASSSRNDNVSSLEVIVLPPRSDKNEM